MAATTRLAAACAAIVATFLSIAGTASASFRGRDGQIALAPTSGNGIVLVAANGRHPHRICAGKAACRDVVDAGWSPDGRQLVIDTAPPTNREPSWSLVYADGSCANCVTRNTGRATFGASPGVLIASHVPGVLSPFERVRSDGGWLASLDNDGRPLPVGSLGTEDVSDAVASSQGLLAVVVPGQIKAGRPGHLRAIGAGTSPSWSPNGRRLAVAYDGWIVLRPLHGRSTRLARGTSPAWSPDGRSIAYLDARHTLRIITLATHHIRVIHGIHGRSIDWGPKPPTTRPRCTVAPGSHTVLSTPTALITDDPGHTPDQYSLYSACLRATGRTRVLGHGFTDADTFGGAAAAGPFVALVDNTLRSANVREWNLRTDAMRPLITSNCVDMLWGPCQITGDDLVLGADGVLAVHVTTRWPTNPQYQEQILTHDRTGTQTRDPVSLPVTPASAKPALTDLTLAGDTLSWEHQGTPMSVTLTPPG